MTGSLIVIALMGYAAGAALAFGAVRLGGGPTVVEGWRQHRTSLVCPVVFGAVVTALALAARPMPASGLLTGAALMGAMIGLIVAGNYGRSKKTPGRSQ